MNRHRSRRHLAALTFLSNISLDGTHRDTNLGRYYNTGKTKSINFTGNTDSSDKENQKSAEAIPGNGLSEENKCEKDRQLKKNFSAEILSDFTETKLLHSSDITFAQSNKEKYVHTDILERSVSFKKRADYRVCLTEKISILSSNESIGVITGTTGSALRGRKASLTYSETSLTNKDVKSIRTDSHSKFQDHRLVFLSKNKIPCHIFSCIPHNRAHRQEYTQKDGVRKRNISGTRPLSTISDSSDPAHIIGLSCFEDPAEISFSDLLIPSKGFSSKPKQLLSDSADNTENSEKVSHHPALGRCFSYDPATHRAIHYVPSGSRSGSLSVSGTRVLIRAMETGNHFCRKSSIFGDREEPRLTFGNYGADVDYIPDMLDDPELRAGKHRKLLRFPSYMTSVTDYTKPLELKKELNDKFREKFPHIHLTLSKLRSLKRELLKIARQECDIDILTVAQAYVYFEKMILKLYVNKQNRKLIAGACLILSAKMNDVKGDVLTNLIEKTETVFRLNRRELLAWELACLVALEFGLHVPTWQVNPHYQRLQFES